MKALKKFIVASYWTFGIFCAVLGLCMGGLIGFAGVAFVFLGVAYVGIYITT